MGSMHYDESGGAAENLLAQLRLRLLGIAEVESTFRVRGFEPRSEAVSRLEAVGRTFILGYRAALSLGEPDACARHLNREIDRFDVGFAFEGAAMAFALLDALTPWRRDRLNGFISGAGSAHVYMLHVGAGWAMARFTPGAWQRWAKLDPLLRWLAIDGLGFHEGYFHPDRSIRGSGRRPALEGYRQRAFDQGLGRALWFVCGADPERIAVAVEQKPVERRADLWSGVGLAAAYAGGVSDARLRDLSQRAGAYRAHLGQGACFAAEARHRAENPCAHTDAACRIFFGSSASRASEWVRAALASLDARESADAYERWRSRVRERCATAAVVDRQLVGRAS